MIEIQVYPVDGDETEQLFAGRMPEVPFPGDNITCREGQLRIVRREYLFDIHDEFVGAILWARREVTEVS